MSGSGRRNGNTDAAIDAAPTDRAAVPMSAATEPDAAATEPGAGTTEAGTATAEGEHVDRADRVAERLAIPVLIAALASIPAVFLSLMSEPWGSLGDGLNTLSGAVLIAETLVLLALAEDRRAWIRRNRWLVLLAAAILPAVVFAVGPVQLLRLVRVVGAFRIIRVNRIWKAGKIVRERTGHDHGIQRVVAILITLACAAFVAIVLVDPSSESRVLLDSVVQRLGMLGVVLAGLVLAVATFVVRTARTRSDEATSTGETTDEDDEPTTPALSDERPTAPGDTHPTG